jgi:4-methylaminobutanoate oxidase (formaldehyde-forming)
MQARPVTVAGVPCTALRVTYVGELGWELYAPTEFGLRLWDALMAAGVPLGMRPGGYRAIDAMRLEKGYRVWGSDITNERDPFSAGLGFAVRMRDREFTGRAALSALDREHPPQRLSCLVLDDATAVAVGNEPVSADGRVVGRVTSGGVGYWLECSIAYAWLPGDLAVPGSRVSVEVSGELVGAEVRAEPLLDPDGHRIKG